MKLKLKITKQSLIRFVIQLVSIAALIIIDRLLKECVIKRLYGQPGVVLIPKVLGLCYAENTGAAFSMFSASTDMLSVITGVALFCVLIAMLFVKKQNIIYHICLPLIVAGGAGNLLDRLTRGYVVDYIQTLFVNFPVFNFADCLITVSCFAIIIYLIYDMVKHPEKKNETPVGEAENE